MYRGNEGVRRIVFQRFMVVLVGAGFVLWISPRSQAGFIDLGNSGWRASWDDQLDPVAQIVLSATGVDPTNNRVLIEKTAQFTEPPVGGVFPSIDILFEQIAPEAVRYIVIEDEIITNQTGEDWTDFHMEILDNPGVVFDPALTLASNGPAPIGFTINPFSQASFDNGNTLLNIWDGVVLDTFNWFPGGGISNGELYIDANPTGSTSFILRETPTPEPGTLAMMALGFGAIRLQCRKRR